MQHIVSNIPITTASAPKALYLRPATLYYLRLEFNGTVGNSNGSNGGNGGSKTAEQVLYKLGYTTTSLHERVYGRAATYSNKWVGNKRKVLRHNGHNGMGLPPGSAVYVISTLAHRNAALVLAWEQYLHSKYRSERWQGLPVLANGNTELYVRDILDLDY